MIQTSINYPNGLPRTLLTPHDEAPVSPLQRTQQASGRSRQRRKYTSVPVMAQCALILNDLEAVTFESWYRDSLKDGAEWFNMPRRVPAGQLMIVARFTGIYQGPVPEGPRKWRYSFELEYYERPLLAPGYGLLPEFTLRPDIFDLAMNREWPAA